MGDICSGKYKQYRKMKKLALTLFAAIFVLISAAQTPENWKQLEKPLNFFLVNDLGRNGYYDQKPIAEVMGKMAETIDIEFVVAAGDVHHFEGVRSTADPLWMTNYELIYSHPDLMTPWYAVCGNHEYRGNTQAVIDYSNISARWNVPSLYYTKVMEEDGATIRIIMIDTPSLLDKYREDSEKYPDAGKQDYKAQLQWLDKTLSEAKEDWVIVVGHHPIYADTDKNDSERKDMQERVDKILRAHKNVDMYLCGHIHNFQHIRKPNCNIDYVVNTSGSLSREVKPVEGTKFCSSATGFSLITVDKKELILHMMDKTGKVIYSVKRTK